MVLSPDPVNPRLFKGIALFTPGGDLVYSLASNKQSNWHQNLCTTLQRLLDLSAPPHFLIPAYTATVDRWFDPYLSILKTDAEIYPMVSRYQPLLNVVFDLGEMSWQIAPWKEEVCNPLMLETYRSQFPQLWENHDLVVRIDTLNAIDPSDRESTHEKNSLGDTVSDVPQGYVLKLFVSSNHAVTKEILKTLHQFLEKELHHPYTLKVIDISKYPELAESYQISATPTLLRVLPQPTKRIVGKLDDLPRILQIIAQ